MINELSLEAFKDYGATSVTKQEYETFLKEYVFEKLKGISLGKAFSEKFNVRDRVLQIFSDDEEAIKHIKYCKYVK
jgi:hypothetical protein